MTMDSNIHSPRDLVDQYFTMWNTGDTAVAAHILSTEWIDHSHPEVFGPDQVTEAVAKIRAVRPGLRFEIETVFLEGDRVCVVGGLGAPDGSARIVSRLAWLFRVSDGRLAELWTYQAAYAD
jgi:ketosteroid isomerase-like protein